MLSKAVRWELIPKNPASKVKAFAELSGRNGFLSVDEAGRLPEERSKHLRPIVLCALEIPDLSKMRFVYYKANNRNCRSITG